MKRFLFLLLLIPVLSFGQTINTYTGDVLTYKGSGTHPWVNLFDTIGAVNLEIFHMDIAMDANDNVYVLGVFRNNDLQIGSETLTNNGTYDVFLCSFDQLGNFRWARSIGSDQNDDRAGMIIDGSDIYIGGAYNGAELFFSHSAVSLQPDDNYDSFLAHYSTDGTLQDAKRIFWGSNIQRLRGISLDATNGYLVTVGSFKEELVHGSTVGDTVTVKGVKDLFIARFDISSGFSNLSFTDISNYYCNISTCQMKGVNNSVIGSSLTGYFISADLIGYIKFSATDSLVSTNESTRDAMIIKLDDNLDYVWSRRGGTTGWDHVNSAIADDNGNIYLAGKYENNATWDSTETLQSVAMPAFGSADMYIVKYNRDGRLLWKNFNGDTGNDDGFGLAIDPEYVQVAGNLSHTGSTNTAFIKYDHDGNYVNQNEILGDGDDIGKGVAFDSEGNTLIAGYFNSDTLFFNSRTTPDAILVNKTGTYDGFIGKYSYPVTVIKTNK